MFPDGIHPAVPRARYDAIDRVNFSTLKLMRRSAAHYRHELIEPSPDTDPKKVGRVVHVACFEPDRFRNLIAVWDGGRRYGKDWDAFQERNEGKELLTENEHDAVLAIQKAVRDDAVAQRYLRGGRGEVTLTWQHRGGGEGVNAYQIACKGRIDFDGREANVDLKVTRDASPVGFGRQVYSLGYHTQSAWYSDGYVRAGGTAKPYVIVAVENRAPYLVQVYRVPEHVLELGREEYSAWMDRLAWCREHSEWPGYFEEEQELELPRWAYPGDDGDDISGEDLQIGGATHGQGLALEEQ